MVSEKHNTRGGGSELRSVTLNIYIAQIIIWGAQGRVLWLVWMSFTGNIQTPNRFWDTMSDRPWSHQSLLFLHTMLLLLYSINTTGLARPDHFGGSFSNTTWSSNISFENPSKLYYNSLSCNFQLVWTRYMLRVTDRNSLPPSGHSLSNHPHIWILNKLQSLQKF